MPPEAESAAREALASVAEGILPAVLEIAAGDGVPSTVAQMVLAPMAARAATFAADCRDGRVPWQRVERGLVVLRRYARILLSVDLDADLG